MVVAIPPKYAVSREVQYIKSQGAKALKAEFPFPQKFIFQDKASGSEVLCVSMGLKEKEIISYVEHQKKGDKRQLQLAF